MLRSEDQNETGAISRRQFLQTAGVAGIALGAQAGATGLPAAVAAGPIKNAVAFAARPLPLSAVIPVMRPLISYWYPIVGITNG